VRSREVSLLRIEEHGIQFVREVLRDEHHELPGLRLSGDHQRTVAHPVPKLHGELLADVIGALD
jgi:hypothetical protein